MNKIKYILEKYNGKNSRYTCPKCGKEKTFSKYVDTNTGEYIHSTVGRCNREIECAYHYKPSDYFKDNEIAHPDIPIQPIKAIHQPIKVIQQPSYISFDAFKASLTSYESNNFIQYLVKLFDTEIATKLIEKYFIGTSKYWPGSTIFWQIDTRGKVKAGKIMGYNPKTGHRIKGEYPQITWVHSALKLPEFNLKQCLFGEHLLKETLKPVAIVESEKTAT